MKQKMLKKEYRFITNLLIFSFKIYTTLQSGFLWQKNALNTEKLLRALKEIIVSKVIIYH